MSRLIKEWHKSKGKEEEHLHDNLVAAVRTRRIAVYTDPRLLDFQGSPVHNSWDHLAPLTILMTLALIVLLAAGVAVGIVAMTLTVFAYLLGNKYFVGWRLKDRTLRYMAHSPVHWQTIWQMGGVALVLKGSNEAPCVAPKGDWRKFALRNLGEAPETPVPDPKAAGLIAPPPVSVHGPEPEPAPPEPPEEEAAPPIIDQMDLGPRMDLNSEGVPAGPATA